MSGYVIKVGQMSYRLWLLLSLFLLPECAWAGQCSLLVLGDSLSAGYGLAPGQGWVDRLAVRMKQRTPEWRVVNASVSGDTTQNGLQRLGPAMARHQPDGVIIELGANDALRGTPPDAIRQNLSLLVRKAKSNGAQVTLLEPPVLPNYGKAYAVALKQLYREIAHRENTVLVPCFVCGVALKPGMMQGDGLHPGERAQEAMLESVWPYLQSRLHCTS